MTARPIHASCVALDGRAILLMGNSGSGKSDLSLRLIDRGWSLVADDSVCLLPSGGTLLAKPPQNIAGRIRVRHVGLGSEERGVGKGCVRTGEYEGSQGH